MKDCRAFRAALRALLEGELGIERSLELEQHARGCASCGRELARERALTQALLALPPAPVHGLDLERNVQAVLARLEAPAAPVRAPRGPRLLRWTALAAAAALAALLGWRYLTPAPCLPPPALAQPAPALARPAPAEPVLDRERLESARAEVCAALRECRPEFDPALDPALDFAGAVDARTDALTRSGWPRSALVQSAAADADAELAARALRWLGVRGEGASRMRAALSRAELAPSALAALVDLGPAGVDELRRAPETPALRALVLALLARGAQPRLAPWIEDALARGRGTAEERAALLEALGACGDAGLQALLRLASRGVLEPGDALARCARIPAAERALADVLADPHTFGIDAGVLLAAVADLGASSGWEWVEREAREGRHEEDALRALARGTPEALAALLHLRAASGTNALLVARTLEQVLREHPDSAASLAPRGTRAESAELFELASGAPEPALVPALIELAACESLPEPDRRWALLLVAEQGLPEHLPRLAQLFPRLRERTLQAAGLIALQALGGSAAVEEALARRPAGLRRRVHALLEDPAGTNRNASTLARLARAIENTLPPPQS
jgi:hypothetical protein